MKKLGLALALTLGSSIAFAQSKTIETLAAKLGDQSIYIATPKARAGAVNEFTVKVKTQKLVSKESKERDQLYESAVRACTKKVMAESAAKDIAAVVAPDSLFQIEFRSGRKDLNKTIQKYILDSIVASERAQVKALFEQIDQKNEASEEILGFDVYQAAIWGDGSAELLGYEGTVVYLTDWHTDTAYVITIYWSYCHC